MFLILGRVANSSLVSAGSSVDGVTTRNATDAQRFTVSLITECRSHLRVASTRFHSGLQTSGRDPFPWLAASGVSTTFIDQFPIRRWEFQGLGYGTSHYIRGCAGDNTSHPLHVLRVVASYTRWSGRTRLGDLRLESCSITQNDCFHWCLSHLTPYDFLLTESTVGAR